MSEENDFTHLAWNLNAELWDEKMGTEGNDFFRVLQLPYILEYLKSYPVNVDAPIQILDIACGNGLLSRKLAELGYKVTAIDFSENLIERAKVYPNPSNLIQYQVIDVSDPSSLQLLDEAVYDHAICNMALFDIASIEPLFEFLRKKIKPAGTFIFSLLHPVFNNSSTIKSVEEIYENEGLKEVFSVKISKYLSIYAAKGIALSGQKHPQYYFNRPIEYYLNLGFQNGFVVDRFNETSFKDEETKNTLSWGSNFHEIPPVLLVRMKKMER